MSELVDHSHPSNTEVRSFTSDLSDTDRGFDMSGIHDHSNNTDGGSLTRNDVPVLGDEIHRSINNAPDVIDNNIDISVGLAAIYIYSVHDIISNVSG